MKTDIEIVEKMLHGRVDNYVVPGLSSFLVGGGEFGKVRLFHAKRQSREWITPHSHRFDLVCVVLDGTVTNRIFQPGFFGDEYSAGFLRSHGMGKYEVNRTGQVAKYMEEERHHEAGSIYSMEASQIHNIEFSEGARVLFLEGPTKTMETVFLEPFIDGKVVPTFEVKPWMFQRGVQSDTCNQKGEP